MGQNENGGHVETPVEELQHEAQKSRRVRRALQVWIVIFTLAVGYAIYTNRKNTSQVEKLARQSTALVKQNKERISDIQQSRYQSCKATYASFHTVFDPFFPPPGQRTPKQSSDLRKFNKIISDKVKRCRAQVQPSGGK